MTNLLATSESFESLRINLVELGAKRLIHRAHLKALKDCDIVDGTGIVHRWIQENYADSMLIGLRRSLDNRKDSFSLIRLLRHVQSDRGFHTIDNFITLCARQHDYDEWYARALYGRYSGDGGTLDRKRIDDDIKTVVAGSVTVLGYVNDFVAHQAANANSTTPSTPLNWADLDRLFDEITGLFNKYYGLVKPGVHVDFDPVLPAGFQRAFDRMVTQVDTTG